jgi:predicted metalloendopeptidase
MGKTYKYKILNKITNKTKKIYKKLNPKYVKSNILTTKKQVCTNKYVAFEANLAEIFKKNGLNFYNNQTELADDAIRNLRKAAVYKVINPKDDFYTYINDKWLKSSQLNENLTYTAQIDDFRIIQDKVYRELNDILIDYFTNPKTKNTKKAIEIKNTYESLLKLNTHTQQQCVAKNILDLFDELRKDKDNLWEIMAFLNSNELTSTGCPFIWTINPDDLHPSIYKSFINPPSVSLIDINIYFEDGVDASYKKKHKTRYFEYLNQLFENAFGINHSFKVENIFNCEYKILNAMGCNLIKSDINNNNYNLITREEALKDFNFDWDIFSNKLGFEKPPSSFVTSSINYLLCGTKLLLEEWNSEEWREYWIYLYIRQQQRFSQRGHKIYYDFFGIYQLGLEGEFDDALRPVFLECFFFNTFLTNAYIDKNRNKEIENYVASMADDLRLVFIRIIYRNKWLQPKTKQKALKKLTKIKFLIGSQHELIEDPLLDYQADDAWGNIIKKALWRHKLAIDLNEKKLVDIQILDWYATPPKLIGTQAYAVNAYYIPTKNMVFISLGYLQSPFIDLNRGIEYNLARVGFTIAHEMSHALDDWGSKYNENGVLDDWWTKKDKNIYKRIQEDIVKQYEVFALRDGIKFDARPTIGEDLADLSGLLICLEYLLDLQLKNSEILPEQDLSFRLFFVYFAIQQKQKIAKKALFAQLKTNPHPLDKYRTNIPLSRAITFRTIYDIKKGDKMWWNNMNKVWLDFK